ncbi:hypothetical protein GCM10009789_43960 [Kribbella sancticallisti]|uniref:Uncharacterized protein n=1 Tax=Kribbella sancticallisti TaxID=460087 RepID=A0ABN2DUU5_9ACTN
MGKPFRAADEDASTCDAAVPPISGLALATGAAGAAMTPAMTKAKVVIIGTICLLSGCFIASSAILCAPGSARRQLSLSPGPMTQASHSILFEITVIISIYENVAGDLSHPRHPVLLRRNERS